MNDNPTTPEPPQAGTTGGVQVNGASAAGGSGSSGGQVAEDFDAPKDGDEADDKE